MASFKSTRNLLLESFDDGVINEDEFLLLYEAQLPRNPDFQYEHVQFNLDEMDDAECMAEFRCQKNDIKMLGEILGLPERFVCYQGTICDRIEGLCIV